MNGLKTLMLSILLSLCSVIGLCAETPKPLILDVNIVTVTDKHFLDIWKEKVLPYLRISYPDQEKVILTTGETIEGPNDHIAYIYAHRDPYGYMPRYINDKFTSMAVIDGYRVLFQSDILKHTFDQYFRIIGHDKIIINLVPDYDVSGVTEWFFTVDDGILYELLCPPVPDKEMVKRIKSSNGHD